MMNCQRILQKPKNKIQIIFGIQYFFVIVQNSCTSSFTLQEYEQNQFQIYSSRGVLTYKKIYRIFIKNTDYLYFFA